MRGGERKRRGREEGEAEWEERHGKAGMERQGLGSGVYVDRRERREEGEGRGGQWRGGTIMRGGEGGEEEKGKGRGREEGEAEWEEKHGKAE